MVTPPAPPKRVWNGRQISITGQIQLVLVLVVVLSLLGTARWLISYSSRLQERQLHQIQQMQSEAVAHDTAAHLAQYPQSLQTVIRYANLFELTSGGQQAVLAQLIRADSAYHALAIIGPTGEVVTAVHNPRSAVPEEWYFSSYWRTSLPHTTPFWSDVFHAPVRADVIDLFVPHTTGTNHLGGLVVRLDLGFLAQTLAQATVIESGYSYIVDQHGHVLASTQPTAALTPAPPQAETRIYEGWQGQQVLGAQSLIALTDWRVVVEVPSAVAFAPLNQVTFGMGVALSVAIVTAVFIGAYLARQLLAPLQNFTEVATRISQGDLHSRVAMTSHNEFGLLARAFNSMADQTQTLIRHMEQRVAELHDTYLALQESQERFRVIAEFSPVPLVIAKVQDGQILYANPRAASILGYSIEELLTRRTTDFYADPEDRTLMLGHLAMHKQLQNYEMLFTQQDGSELWTSLVVTPLTFAGQQALFTAVQDITEQKAAAKALKAYSEQLEDMVEARTHELRQSNTQLVEAKNSAEAASQAKTLFLANVSHELRTPLNAILGFTQLLQRSRDVVPEDQEYLDIIYQSGRHLLNLINDVLEMSKIEAGQMVVSKSQFDLHQLLNSLRSMFTSKAEAKGLSLLVQYTADVPQHILSDERKLAQILINLLNNGLKFTDAGYVSLSVTAQPDGENLTRLRFEVRDTGVGISAQEQTLLFRPFTQASSGQQAQEGTGLGLALSQQLVRLLGGEMALESALGRGSTFSFAVRVESLLPSNTAANQPPTSRIVIGLAPNQPPYRLLIVEDRHENRLLLSALLGAVGFVVKTANNGQEGVAVAQEWRPDLIFMDIRMPLMDGYEATGRIKQELTPAPPIVALTAGAFDEERGRALAAGCDDFVPKPFQEEDLWRVLEQQLGVQFLHENDGLLREKQVPLPLSAASLQLLDAEWRALLYQAAIMADQQKMLHLVSLIQGEHPATAEMLTTLVRQFATRELLDLLEKA